MALPLILAGLDIPEHCIDERTSAQENRRKFEIRRHAQETVYRIKVDDCWLSNQDGKKVDYLFWCANGKERLSLVELKGGDFGKALEQVESTLRILFQQEPQLRQFADTGGICSYVVLSKGSGVRQRLKEIARLKKTYKVIVRPHGQQLEINGLDALC